MHRLRLPSSRAAIGAAAALVLTAAARLADAQPACAAGVLAAYLAPGHACTIGPWRLADFSYTGGGFGELDEHTATADAITLFPFAGVGPTGERGFGFQFDGFTASVAPAGAAPGIDGALAGGTLSFSVAALRPGPTIVGGAFLLSADVTGDAAGAALMDASAWGFIFGPGWASPGCGGGSATQAYAPGHVFVDQQTVCVPGPLAAAVASLSTAATFLSYGAEPPSFSATASARVERVVFLVGPTVVPEPSAAALVAGGLAALAGAGRVARRRRR